MGTRRAICLLLAAVVLAVANSAATASIQAVGPLTPTGSWQQTLQESGAHGSGTFDAIGIQVISGGQVGDAIDGKSPLSKLTNNWSETAANDLSAVISGHNKVSVESFCLTFLDKPISMYFEAYDGNTNVDYGILTCNNDGSWSYQDLYGSSQTPSCSAVIAVASVAVPEPATVIIWSVLGSIGMGLVWWRRFKPA